MTAIVFVVKKYLTIEEEEYIVTAVRENRSGRGAKLPVRPVGREDHPAERRFRRGMMEGSF